MLEAFGDEIIDDSEFRNADGTIRYTPDENEIWHHQHTMRGSDRWVEGKRSWCSGDVLIADRRGLISTEDPSNLHWHEPVQGGIPYIVHPHGRCFLLFSSLDAWRRHVAASERLQRASRSTLVERVSNWFRLAAHS